MSSPRAAESEGSQNGYSKAVDHILLSCSSAQGKKVSDHLASQHYVADTLAACSGLINPVCLFVLGATAHSGPGPPHSRSF
jgi:hypothetical protein